MDDRPGLTCRRWMAVGVLCVVLGAARTALGVSPKEGLHIETGAKAVTAYDGSIPLLEYRYTGVPFKPCVAKWYSPASTNVLRDAPHDHLHHHALMLAVTADGVDFWVERKTSGRQMHRAFGPVTAVQRGGASQAAFTEMLDWLGPDAKPILTERRTIVVYRAKTLKASLLTWQSRLAPAAGRASVKLTGAHYHGLGMRFVASMDKVGRFCNPTGKGGTVVRGTERLVPAKWCAYTAPVEGKPMTVAMFDHPDNPRPALWFTMTHPFAYLSATMNLWKQPLTLQAKQPLALRYGAALWDGKAQPQQIEEMYKQWLDRSSPQKRTKKPE